MQGVTKLTQIRDNHENNSRQNPHPGQTLNKITHSPLVPQEDQNRFVHQVAF